MSKIKKIGLFLLPVLMLFIQFIPFKTVLAETTDPYYEKIQQKGELIVGLSADYAPYEFHAEIDGKDTIVGFDISIAQKIADDMGVKLHIEELGFDALLGALKTGKIDLIISGMAVTEERLKEVDFSDTYMTMKQRVIVRKDDADKYKNTLDFEGVPVGVQKQTTQEALAQNELVGSVPTSLQKIPDVIMNLKNEKVDAAILEGPVAEAYVDRNPDLVFADVEFKDGDKDTAVAVPKNAPVLLESINTSIKEIKDEGLLEEYKKEANELMFHDEQGFFAKYYKFYVNGAGYTIFLALIGVLFGTILGAFLALMKLAKSKFVRILATIYIEYVRGTPLLVQIFIVYFGTGILGVDMSRLAAGCIALALNSGAYVAEIIRAGITAVNKGQLEAARSLGMNQTQAMRFIIFPQAIKNILPALGNEFVTVIKESSVVSVIGVSELIFQAGNVQGASFKPFLPYVIVSLIYFVLTFTLSRLLGVAERRMNTSD
ncbi:amino acid ABC transporter amino acid-binding/permease [Enterococcus sp. DIV2402]|uniref:Amino acid ABC transporter amino acid-binding/permease n=1 Tax=Candidatus Enterococcus lowellii TaxID=2230877 RepID=A0ABZ2SP36_9ENTE|nr:ABC transporter permease subunit [Enterococcus sp. DIV2402]